MSKDRSVHAGTGAVGGLGVAAPATGKEKETREHLSLALSKDLSESIKALAAGFGMPRSHVLADLAEGEGVQKELAARLRELYARYDAERRASMPGVFGKAPEPAIQAAPDAQGDGDVE